MYAPLVSGLILLSLVVFEASSAPVQPKYKILSLHSAKFVSSTQNGDVHAKAGDTNDPSTDFYQHTREFPKVSYESVQSPGKFLILDEETAQLRVEEPRDGNEVFMQVQHPLNYGLFALKSYASRADCYVAFDLHGAVSTDPHICNEDELHSGHGLATSVHILAM
jgi:hypothetical protein